MKRLVSSLLLVAIGVGCGPTNREVLESYRSQFDEVRRKLAIIPAILPKAGSVRAPVKGTFDPPLSVQNTDTLHLEQVKDVYVDPPLDLMLSKGMKLALTYTGDKNPLRIMDATASDSFESTFTRALKKRYLVVHRTVRIQLPVAETEKTFRPGGVHMEGFVVDFETMELKAQYAFVAKNSEKVGYKYRKGDDPKTGLQSWARSDLWERAREQVQKGLEAVSGGEFPIR